MKHTDFEKAANALSKLITTTRTAAQNTSTLDKRVEFINAQNKVSEIRRQLLTLIFTIEDAEKQI